MLAGIRVLDLSRVIAGPYCAALMADLGADVVKLERPGRGDDLRAWRGGDGMSAAFAAINRGKRGVAIELQHPEGARLAFELARRADVIVENFLPGVAARLGLGYETVSAVNPRVVYASVTGFGQTGPHARRPGYNTIAQGVSGLMALTGMPGQPPTRVGGSVSDLAAALCAFGAANAALVHRFRTGAGQHLDVNLLASTLSLLPDPVAQYFDTGQAPRRLGNRNANLTPAEARDIGSFLLNDLEIVAGLQYAYYEGEWDKLPKFDALQPIATGDVRELVREHHVDPFARPVVDVGRQHDLRPQYAPGEEHGLPVAAHKRDGPRQCEDGGHVPQRFGDRRRLLMADA